MVQVLLCTSDRHQTTCESPPFLCNADLVIAKEGAPGAAVEHEGLYERSFGLDGVVQVVSGPCMQHLCQGDCAKLRMLRGAFQVVILHLCEQGETFLTTAREFSDKLLRSLCIRVCVLLVWIEISEILPCQKSSEADRKDQALRVH